MSDQIYALLLDFRNPEGRFNFPGIVKEFQIEAYCKDLDSPKKIYLEFIPENGHSFGQTIRVNDVRTSHYIYVPESFSGQLTIRRPFADDTIPGHEAADEAPDYSLIITGMKWR